MRKRDLYTNPISADNGDPEKFGEAVYRTAYLDDPPLRLPVHAVTLNALRKKAKQFLETADEWEAWSEELLIKE